MATLRLKQDNISDVNLYKLANIGCLPAIHWLIYRSTKTQGPRKQRINKSLKALRKISKRKGLDYPFSSYSVSQLPKNKMMVWHPYLLDLPIYSLVNPINGMSLNKKIIQSSKIKSSLRDLVTPINFDRLKLNGVLLSKSELNKIITSLVMLNWEFKKSSSTRPKKEFLNYYVDEDLFQKVNASKLNNIISRINPEGSIDESSIMFILFFVSKELVMHLNKFSTSSLEKIRKAYFIYTQFNKRSKEEGLIKILPAYAMLREDNLDSMFLLETLSAMGYSKINHLKFLDHEILQLLLSKELQKTLSDL